MPKQKIKSVVACVAVAALSCAAFLHGQTNVAKILETDNFLMRAVKEGSVKNVNQYLTDGVDADLPNSDGFTPMVVAAYKGDVNVMKALTAAGADPNLAGAHGITPLIAAAANNNLNAVKYLVNEQAAYPNIPDSLGKTAAQHACENGHIKVLEFLSANNADTERASVSGDNCLTLAIKNKESKIVSSLLKSGANVNFKDGEGRSAAQLAAEFLPGTKIEKELTEAYRAHAEQFLAEGASAAQTVADALPAPSVLDGGPAVAPAEDAFSEEYFTDFIEPAPAPQDYEEPPFAEETFLAETSAPDIIPAPLPAGDELMEDYLPPGVYSAEQRVERPAAVAYGFDSSEVWLTPEESAAQTQTQIQTQTSAQLLPGVYNSEPAARVQVAAQITEEYLTPAPLPFKEVQEIRPEDFITPDPLPALTAAAPRASAPAAKITTTFVTPAPVSATFISATTLTPPPPAPVRESIVFRQPAPPPAVASATLAETQAMAAKARAKAEEEAAAARRKAEEEAKRLAQKQAAVKKQIADTVMNPDGTYNLPGLQIEKIKVKYSR